MSDLLTSNKDALRERAHATRAALREKQGDIGEALARNFSAGVNCGQGGCVAGYAPIRSEADPRPILSQLVDEGWRCALPTVIEGREQLVFRAWRFGDALNVGQYGISEPEPSQSEVSPGLILVPILAFDDLGHRLGYGAGYYDRTLARLRGQGGVLAVGLAYAGCRVDAISTDPHDETMDLIVTEAGVIQPKQAAA